MRAPALLLALLLAVAPAAARAQCDPAPRRPRDPFAQALAAMRAPLSTPVARPKPRRTATTARRVATVHATPTKRVHPRKRRRVVAAKASPKPSVASTSTACRRSSDFGLPTAEEPTIALAQALESPLVGMPAAPAVNLTPLTSVPAVEVPTQTLAAGALGATIAIGSAPGISAGILVGAAVAAGAGGAVWEVLHLTTNRGHGFTLTPGGSVPTAPGVAGSPTDIGGGPAGPGPSTEPQQPGPPPEPPATTEPGPSDPPGPSNPPMPPSTPPSTPPGTPPGTPPVPPIRTGDPYVPPPTFPPAVPGVPFPFVPTDTTHGGPPNDPRDPTPGPQPPHNEQPPRPETAVPEPTTAVLFATGLVAAGVMAARRRRR